MIVFNYLGRFNKTGAAMKDLERNLKMAVLLRTCDIVSHKYPSECTLFQNKKFHLLNAILYCKENSAKFYVVCDTGDDNYYNFVCDVVGDDGCVIRSLAQSNSGSFARQIELAIQIDADIIEIAEDDFLKRGRIDFAQLDKNIFYTAYEHPQHDSFWYKILMKLFKNEFSTVCSFVAHKDLLVRNANNFLSFGNKSDAEMWRIITTPWYLELFFNLRNMKIGCSFKRKHSLRRLKGVTWVHIAKDSLPIRFSHYKSLEFKQLRELWS